MKVGSDHTISMQDVLHMVDQPGQNALEQYHRVGEGFHCVYTVTSCSMVDWRDPNKTLPVEFSFQREQYVRMDKDVVNAYLNSSRSSFEELCVFLDLIIKCKRASNVGDDRTASECADLVKMFNCLPADKVADIRIDIDRSFYEPVRQVDQKTKRGQEGEEENDSKKATQSCSLC